VHYERQPLVAKRSPPPSLDALLASLAARQHGLVTAAQFVELGVSHAAISSRARAGRLHRVHRGVYAVGHPHLSREARWMAAVLAAGDGAALTGRHAAVLWQIWKRRTGVIEVLAPLQRRAQAGFRLHYCRRLDPRDVIVHNRIRVVTVARLLVDLTETMTAEQIATVIHEAAWRTSFSEPATRAAMARANGRRQLAILDDAIAMNAAGSAGTRSTNEDDFLALVHSAGLPEPLTNVRAQGLEVDFRWPGLCVEVDAHGHTRQRTRNEDQARDATLKSDGQTILRITADDLEADPAKSLARVQAALEKPSPSPAAVRQPSG
jgi:hypothetical protein